MKNDKLNDLYGPGDDNYGRDKSPLLIMDDCVYCGKETKYPKHMDIDFRMHYVEGAGQLCEKCYDEIYNPPRA